MKTGLTEKRPVQALKKSICYSSVLSAAWKPTLTECLRKLDVWWLVQKVYYCFDEAAAQRYPLAFDGSKNHLYSFTKQASKAITKLSLNCSIVSLFWLWCKIIIRLKHTRYLLVVVWCWSSWAGRFLSIKRHNWMVYCPINQPVKHLGSTKDSFTADS